MVNQIEKIMNANVYLDDVNFVGRALEVEIAKVTVKTTDHQTLARHLSRKLCLLRKSTITLNQTLNSDQLKSQSPRHSSVLV